MLHPDMHVLKGVVGIKSWTGEGGEGGEGS